MWFTKRYALKTLNTKYHALFSQSDAKQQKWSMFWMAIALGHRDLCQKAWDRMEWEPREKTIFDVFESEEEVNRIIGVNIQLFADFVLLLLRNKDSVEFIMYIRRFVSYPRKCTGVDMV